MARTPLATPAELAVGLDLYHAKTRLRRAFPELDPDCFDVTYIDCGKPRGLVVSCEVKKDRVHFTVASPNPVRHLPVNYQDNAFLQNYMMIFQHIANETSITLDNLHHHFNPMECPTRFLPLLADWFGIHLDTLGGEDEVRRFLRYAIQLYRVRGTALGLKAHLTIITGIVPEILEGVLPFEPLEIDSEQATESNLFEAGIHENCFTVYFPVERDFFDDNLVKRVSRIVQQEKPVHSRCFISFKKLDQVARSVTVITQDTVMDADVGMTF